MRTREDVIRRLKEIANIVDGWDDWGEGKSYIYDNYNIERFIKYFNKYFPDDLPMPLPVALFSGDIALDWMVGEPGKEIFIMMDFDTYDTDLRAEIIQTNILKNENHEDTLYLTRKEHWDILIGRIQKALGDNR